MIAQRDPGDNLLTISQAARFLQVSQISLRRWTDSGKLKCLRIGPRRERRFRKDDLLSFAGNPEQEAKVSEIPAASVAERPVEALCHPDSSLTLEGLTVNYGSHLCSLYESDRGRLKMSVPFLAEGLRRQDVCYLVASSAVSSKIIAALRQVEEGVDEALRNRLLRVSEGAASAEAMCQYFESEFIDATQSGTHAIRVLGDMAWFLDHGLSLAELSEFEIRYNHNLGRRFPVVSLCQYDARRFNGSGILIALKSHEDTFNYPLSRFISI
ncbi:MAG: MEDS domain-containing protein [Pseudomonadales bacterium]|nr:MEDS domain-containing protein [Pseudomonadales bacterium]